MFTINRDTSTTPTFANIPERDFFFDAEGDLYLKMYSGEAFNNAINFSKSPDEAVDWSGYWKTFEEEDMVFPAAITIEARMI